MTEQRADTRQRIVVALVQFPSGVAWIEIPLTEAEVHAIRVEGGPARLTIFNCHVLPALQHAVAADLLTAPPLAREEGRDMAPIARELRKIVMRRREEIPWIDTPEFGEVISAHALGEWERETDAQIIAALARVQPERTQEGCSAVTLACPCGKGDEPWHWPRGGVCSVGQSMSPATEANGGK